MERIFNFSAGPSMLPLEILEIAQREMLNFHGCGMSIIEVSHRSKIFESVLSKSFSDLRELLSVPPNFKILYMQGGGSLQFASVPLNMLKDKTSANYLVTGSWSEKAAEEAAKYSKVNIVATGKATNFSNIPDIDSWNIDPEGAYFHYCTNETIHGIEFELTDEMIQKIGNLPIVADMSSNFLSKPIDFQRHAVIYAGAQKNAGPSGLAVVFVREDMLGHSLKITPTMCDWKIASDNGSMYNTPPTFTIYMCGLYFDYIKRNGGIAAFNELASRKSALLYDTIQNSGGFFTCVVHPAYRSRMNVTYLIRNGSADLEKKFIAEAEKAGFNTLAGHRSIGGIRASLYNGMPLEGVVKLTEFMREFQANNS